MNIEFDIRPHFEFLVMVLCTILRVLSFGVFRMEPKGIDEFSKNAVAVGQFVGAIAGFAILLAPLYLYLYSLIPR
jgi:hypothetical protein